jgi:hypothetical protein
MAVAIDWPRYQFGRGYSQWLERKRKSERAGAKTEMVLVYAFIGGDSMIF